jgi:hypothetical protein
LVERDMNHEAESMDRPSVSTQCGEKTLQWEN